jgi:hypothetical protein
MLTREEAISRESPELFQTTHKTAQLIYCLVVMNSAGNLLDLRKPGIENNWTYINISKILYFPVFRKWCSWEDHNRKVSQNAGS